MRSKILACLAGLCLALASCGGGGGGSADTATNPTTGSGTGAGSGSGGGSTGGALGQLTGTVRLAATREALAGATVSYAGQSATTDARGDYTLSGVPVADRAVVKIRADGHAELTKTARVDNDRVRRLDVLMRPVAFTTTIDPASGLSIRGDSPEAGGEWSLVLPANGLVREDGQPIVGRVTVDVTPFGLNTVAGAIPGDFSALGAAAEEPVLLRVGVTVNLRDAQGAKVNLARGQTAQVFLPTATRSKRQPAPAATAPLVTLDESTSRWVNEGTAVLTNQDAYALQVSHFSDWAISISGIFGPDSVPLPGTVRGTGCVLDATNSPVGAGIEVKVEGISVPFERRQYTTAGGCYQTFFPFEEESIAQAVNSHLALSAPVLVTPTPSNTDGYGVVAAPGTIIVPTHRAQNLVMNLNLQSVVLQLNWVDPSGGLWIGTNHGDLDAKLITPDGRILSASNPGTGVTDPDAVLNVPAQNAPGPEVLSILRPLVGTYRLFVSRNLPQGNDFSFEHLGPRVLVQTATQQFVVLGSFGGGRLDSTVWHALDIVVAHNCVRSFVLPRTELTSPPPFVPVAKVFCTP